MIRTSSLLFWLGLIVAASLALYRTSDRAHQLDNQLRSLSTQIESEQKSIHVLRAEWVYLANPARIEVTAKRYLAMRPTVPRQIVSLDTLSEIIPTRKEAMGSTSISAMPLANVKTSLAAVAPRSAKRKVTVAAIEEAGHINERMVMQHTASAQSAGSDSIGALITRLGGTQ